MRQRYLRLISALLLLAVLTACGTDRGGRCGRHGGGSCEPERRLLVLLTDEGGVPDL